MKNAPQGLSLTFLTLPLSTNALHGVFNGRKLLSARGRANKEAIEFEASAQYQGLPYVSPVAVTVALRWPTRRNHDIDNIKTLLDTCNGILWEDDGQIVELHITKAYDRDNPGVDMTVVPI